MNRREAVTFIEKHKAVAVIRLPDPDLFEPVAHALYEGGVKVLEITMTVPDAISLIKKAVSTAKEDMLIGVGSVLDSDTAKRAIDAGARFVVSPILKEEVIRTSHDHDTAVMPGTFTPTEAQTAWELGADVIKIFPADVVGMAFFKGIKAPMPHLKLMPTGGVSLTNANQWIAAGACAVGVGSALVDKEAISEKNFDQIRKNAQMLTDTIKTI